MVAVKAKDVDRYMANPDPGKPIILVYGPDAGLVQERADTLIRSFVDDPRDPFQSGPDCTNDPGDLLCLSGQA